MTTDALLHYLGYNYFTIPKLTYPEIDRIIEAHETVVREKKKYGWMLYRTMG